MAVEGVQNPILGYKLDPGEPGLSHSAPASRSILRVLSQEISNWLAFKREAERNGGVIIQGGITLDLRKRGSFIAAIAGKTTVWIYYPSQQAQQPAENSYKDHIQGEIQKLEARLNTAASEEERQKLEEQLALLKMMMNMPAQLLRDLLMSVGIFLDVLV
ncbi:MAG TPA: hypothetical protein PLP64_03670 [Pseudothermotoga sp.]|nr:hypothetical protein [Pseudothermotoga sp.]HOK83305.1 hypothetical protein [Pseudothermotoga sp.]HPP70130.1 hypothetical protein [Pseudothermotoga sp.]